jgi:hypothetical protein
MERRRQISSARTAGLLTIAVAWALLLTLTGSPEAILFTVPVFLLAAPLALGRYIGEELIEALRAKPARRLARPVRFGYVSRELTPASHLAAGRGFGRAPPVTAG